MQIVRYKNKGYFNPHQDQCNRIDRFCIEDTRARGVRFANLLIYLEKDTNSSGGTKFVNLNKTYNPEIGNGILFFMLNEEGTGVHPYAKHQGLSVEGNKWICNVWIRTPKYLHSRFIELPKGYQPNLITEIPKPLGTPKKVK